MVFFEFSARVHQDPGIRKYMSFTKSGKFLAITFSHNFPQPLSPFWDSSDLYVRPFDNCCTSPWCSWVLFFFQAFYPILLFSLHHFCWLIYLQVHCRFLSSSPLCYYTYPVNLFLSDTVLFSSKFPLGSFSYFVPLLKVSFFTFISCVFVSPPPPHTS